ncbi:hypothetical protein [Streptomyces sp. BA2]|uniref:hypothetical protein n=1 Tax=Streptomyces sp. BA2 TaxID=436595 RepID=UPI001329A2EC|nr:hypothetical protein [Streptomyces sp. BA2]MWA14687.1 hypothetical protein [Streptomyces sp. BA2]
MTYWFRRADADSDDWFETGDDAVPVRQASFRGPEGPASVAASRDELAWALDKFEPSRLRGNAPATTATPWHRKRRPAPPRDSAARP